MVARKRSQKIGKLSGAGSSTAVESEALSSPAASSRTVVILSIGELQAGWAMNTIDCLCSPFLVLCSCAGVGVSLVLPVPSP